MHSYFHLLCRLTDKKRFHPSPARCASSLLLIEARVTQNHQPDTILDSSQASVPLQTPTWSMEDLGKRELLGLPWSAYRQLYYQRLPLPANHPREERLLENLVYMPDLHEPRLSFQKGISSGWASWEPPAVDHNWLTQQWSCITRRKRWHKKSNTNSLGNKFLLQTYYVHFDLMTSSGLCEHQAYTDAAYTHMKEKHMK